MLEVCFGLCMQNREEVFGEEASRAGIGKAVGNSVLVKEQYWKRCFSALVGCPLQVKIIQHAQADHPLSLAQLLLG